MSRAIILMMDSFGIGGAHDAEKFDNAGADTFGHIVKANGGLRIPNLHRLGLTEVATAASGQKADIGPQPESPMDMGCIRAHMSEISVAKDTTSGHWEMAGVPVLKDWGYFKPDYPSFPDSLIADICREGKIEGILGNIAASGTEIIQQLGEEHIKTGKPIFYTSADSNIQIAAHEEHFGLERLYKLCEVAYQKVKPYNIARIIARPFVGEKVGSFTRTANRHDYSVLPFAPTVLDKMKISGGNVIAIGKINDIYAGQGITKALHASGLEELWDVTLEEMMTSPENTVIFTNFVDFDMLWGHRRNVKGYADGLEYFDTRLPDILPLLRDDDIVFITADHGNDPTYKGTDHTREQVPMLLFGKKIQSRFAGESSTFADIGQTIAHYFGLMPFEYGKSFL